MVKAGGRKVFFPWKIRQILALMSQKTKKKIEWCFWGGDRGVWGGRRI